MVAKVVASSRRRVGLFPRWNQFSFRLLLVALSLSAVMAGWWATYVAPYRKQRQFAQLIAAQGGSVRTQTDGPSWVVWLLGADSLQTIVEVRLEGNLITDECLRELRRLPDLERLALGHRSPGVVSPTFYPSGLETIERLDLSGTRVTDEGVSQLRACANLRTLFLDHTVVTDASLDELEQIPALQVLWIRGTAVTAERVGRLREARPDLYVGW